MQILASYKDDRQGNDCLIMEAIALIRVTYGLYIVTHTTQVIGSWTGNPVETRCENFDSHEEAKAYFNELYEQIK